MNNMMSPIATYLQLEGFEVTLFLLNEFSHFTPSADSDNPIELNIVKLGWTEENFSKISTNDIRKQLKGYQFIIGTDYAAAFCNKANIQMDIYFPAGTDLSEWPFKQSKRLIPYRWEFNIILCSRAQFYGIKQAKYLAIDPTNKEYEEKIIKIRGNSNHTENIPYHYLPYFDVEIQLPDYLQEYMHKINAFTFRIINHGRQEWTIGEESVHYKGNERLIEGFKEFLISTKSKSVLILLEYGGDVDASKELIKKLELEDNIIWLPKMLRKHLIYFIRMSNVGIGVFGKGWYSSCSIYEVMIASKPLITYYEPQTQQDIYPYLKANNAQEICAVLRELYEYPIKGSEIGKQSNEWLLKKNKLRIVNVINKINNKVITNRFINYFRYFPYYNLYYKFLLPIAWLNEFVTIRMLRLIKK